MNQSFSPAIAQIIGLNEAIVYANLSKINEIKGIEDDWIYCSAKNMESVFPYFEPRTMHRILKRLEDNGFIVSRNLNNSRFDRTKSYFITHKK